MIRHIVLWKLDLTYNPEEKKVIKKQIAEKLLPLKNEISFLLSINVFFNSEAAVESNYDVMLDTVFESIEDLKNYQVHPAHLKVAEYIKSLKLQRAAIDYSY